MSVTCVVPGTGDTDLEFCIDLDTNLWIQEWRSLGHPS